MTKRQIAADLWSKHCMEKSAHFRAGLDTENLVHSIPRVISAIIDAIPDAPPEPPLWEGEAIVRDGKIYSIAEKGDSPIEPNTCGSWRRVTLREVRE